jgi:hypothetical protein
MKAHPVNISPDALLAATAPFPGLSMMRPRPVFTQAGLHQRLKLAGMPHIALRSCPGHAWLQTSVTWGHQDES